MSGILLIIYLIILSLCFFIMGVGLNRFFRFRIPGDKADLVTYGFIVLFALTVFISLILILKAEWTFAFPNF